MVNSSQAFLPFFEADVLFKNVSELTLVFALILIIAELVHLWRCKQIAQGAWGIASKVHFTLKLVAILRIVSLSMFVWGALILTAYLGQFEPPVHATNQQQTADAHHFVFLLDVSPSMLFPQDAGADRKQTRMKRAQEIYKSISERLDHQQGRYSVIAFWNDAKIVVADTPDLNIIDNIFNDLPLTYAMQNSSLKTAITKALEVVSKLGEKWKPNSATLFLISDGDVLPETGLPKLPESFGKIIALGVGDPIKGVLVENHYSKQNFGHLNDFATRFGGLYFDANERLPATEMITSQTTNLPSKTIESWTLRDYGFWSIFSGAVLSNLCWILLRFTTQKHLMRVVKHRKMWRTSCISSKN